MSSELKDVLNIGNSDRILPTAFIKKGIYETFTFLDVLTLFAWYDLKESRYGLHVFILYASKSFGSSGASQNPFRISMLFRSRVLHSQMLCIKKKSLLLGQDE